jgi:flagellar basal body-associated protein FliL
MKSVSDNKKNSESKNKSNYNQKILMLIVAALLLIIIAVGTIIWNSNRNQNTQDQNNIENSEIIQNENVDEINLNQDSDLPPQDPIAPSVLLPTVQ